MKKQILLTLVFLAVVKIISAQQKGEALKIVWPEEYKWKIGSNQENKSIHMMELIPGKERITKWTIIGTMLSIKGVKNVPMDRAMNTTFEQARLNAPRATLTLVEKDDKAQNPWVLFKIEAPEFNNDKNPESQLYYVIQGNQSLYSNFVALKEKNLDSAFVEKWSKVFKSSELMSFDLQKL